MVSIRETLTAKRILVTGASGFLGKVWLAHLLEDLPELERVYVLLRPGARGARARLEDLLARSPAFWPLHERHGDDLGRVAGRLFHPLAGDVAQPNLGLDPEALERLGRLDAVVHLAGLTDLEPHPTQAVAANVDGAAHALELARRTGAALLHVSTAYVAGRRRGEIAEVVAPDAPLSAKLQVPFSWTQELEGLRALATRVAAEASEPPRAESLLAHARAQLRRHGRRDDETTRAEFLARERDHWIEQRLGALAADRARHWGWPNVYTFTKALAEHLVSERAAGVPLAILRPAIVESAEAFPFPGWKEGRQTSAPLVWAMTRGPLRGLPADRRLALDVIPVDHVARGLTLGLAGLLQGRQLPGAHMGTSHLNPLPMQRAIELTNLAEREGPPSARDLLRPQAVPVGKLGYRLASLPLLRRVAQGAQQALELTGELLPTGLPRRVSDRVEALSRRVGRAERKLSELERVVETFRPFVLENTCTFSTSLLTGMTAELDPDERTRFGFDPAALDWARYWTQIHVPGLRRWVYPDLEGKRPERGPVRPVTLLASQPENARA